VEEFKPVVAVMRATAAADDVCNNDDDDDDEYTPAAQLLPFHLTVLADAKLDVIYYMLRQYPDALLLTEAATLASCS
jgi:hypothetical protein